MSTAPIVTEGPSLRGRALLAVALTIAFYAMALVIALGLIAAPIALWADSHRGNVWLTIAMIGAGGAILRAIVPARDRFEAPGPELTRERHPRLHALLDDVATKAGAEPAHEVYLDLDANASVLEHRRRRKMILGLPLLATLGQDELRAVVAHEYGHFVGGDTRFSGWIWRTRVAAMKTVGTLATSESWFRRNVVRWPFEAYARLFLRVTNAISRRAEFAADALAARVAGPLAAGCALRRINAVAPAWDMYWRSDVTPMLQAERLPPVARGFAEMTAHRELSTQLDDVVRSGLEQRESDPYASHPTLRQRLEALGVEVEGRVPDPPADRAADLLEDADAAERELLEHWFARDLSDFQVAGWDSSGEVHLASLRDIADDLGPIYDGATFAAAGDVAASIADVRPALRERLGPEDAEAPDEAIDALALQVLGACCVVAAADSGRTVTAPPGEPVRVWDGDAALDAFGLLGDIAEGKAQPAAWREHPVTAGAASAPLGRRSPSAA